LKAKNLFRRLKRRRPLGRPRRRWNIEINPKDISLEGRFILDVNCSWLVVLVKAVTELRVA